MSMSRQVHCRFCGQTFVTEETERCPLCRKSGGFVDPHSPAAVEDLIAEKLAEPAPLPPPTTLLRKARLLRRAWGIFRLLLAGVFLLALGGWLTFDPSFRSNPRSFSFQDI